MILRFHTFILVVIAFLAGTGISRAQEAGDSVIAAEPETPLTLSSSVNFRGYSLDVPAGLFSKVPQPDQLVAALPSGKFRLMMMTSPGKPKHINHYAAEAARSLGLSVGGLKSIILDDMEGYYTSQRVENKIVTFALIRGKGELLTIVIREPETLQSLGMESLRSLTKN